MLLGDPIVYWFVRIVLVTILWFCGWGISTHGKDEKNFWLWAWPAIISYSLVEGLRWNRGRDYYHYYQDLTGRLFTDYSEPLYLLWIDVFKFSGLPYWVAFVFYSFLLILGVILILKKIPQIAIWVLPLFYIITESKSENLIRQFFAIPFILYAFYFYLGDKKKYMFVSLICCVLIHLSGLYAVILFLFFTNIQFKTNKKIPLTISILYSYLFWFGDNVDFSFVTDFLSSLNVSDDVAFAGYVNNSERWFSEEGSIANVLGTKAASLSLISQIARFLSSLTIIFAGYHFIKNNREYNVVYWLSIFAIIIDSFGGDIEMYQRLVSWTIYLIPFTIGLMFSASIIKDMDKKYLFLMGCVIVVNYVFYGFIRNIGSIPYSGCAFIWDK